MQILKQSTAFTTIVGPILDSAGAEYTGAVIADMTITKNGTSAAMAAAATLTHIANGYYTLVGTTGNSDTLGRLDITCNKSTYQMPPVRFSVLAASNFDTLVTNGVLASTQRTIKRIAPGGGGDYTSLSAAITALSSTTGIIELVCSAGNIGGGNLHSLTSATEVILRSDVAARHRHDTAQALTETAYFASDLVFNPTGSGPSKLRIEGMRSSGVSTIFSCGIDATGKTYVIELVDNLFFNSGGAGAVIDQVTVELVDGTLNVLAVGNSHFFTTTGTAKGYQAYVTNAGAGDTAVMNVRAYNNTGNTNDSSKVIDGIAFGATAAGGTGTINADCRNNLILGVAGSGTVGAINIVDSGGTTTLTGSNNATNDSSASANGMTSGQTSVVAASVLSSPTTSNVQLSTSATIDAGYALQPAHTVGRTQFGGAWDIGSHEYQSGLSLTKQGYLTAAVATATSLASLSSTVGAAGAGLTAVGLASTGLDAIAVTAPTGVATTFPGMVVQLWRRFFKKSTLTSTQLKTYADDGTTVVTTQTCSDDGSTQTQGVSS